jgi:hypothetical protein
MDDSISPFPTYAGREIFHLQKGLRSHAQKVLTYDNSLTGRGEIRNIRVYI